MSKCLTSAPGKLVLAGEYAVLEGYSGIAIAVDKRAFATAVSSPVWQVEGMGLGPYAATLTDRSVVIADDVHHAFDLFVHVALEAQKKGYSFEPKHVQIDSSALYHKIDRSHHKLGLGSSAAVTVALSAQFINPSVSAWRERVFDLAYFAHRRFTHRRGSGIDVAASCYGGLIRFRRREGDELPDTTPLSLKIDNNTLIGVYSGKSQKTGAFIHAVSALRSRQPTDYHALMKNLGDLAEAFEQALCVSTSWPMLISIVEENCKILGMLGKMAHIDLMTGVHQRLATLAQRYGGAAKPSGAGGGDMAICFIPQEQQPYFLRELQAVGLKALPLSFGAPGVQIHSLGPESNL